ncbi:MAG TPA: family 43 glycosylhydrolase [Puia sp.]|nr:family 43 glycosylhydrolase [Puia sp.]
MKKGVIHRVSKICFLFGILIVFVWGRSRAQNPVIRDQFSADPSARVFGDRVYLYPSHDIPVVNGRGRPGWFCMQDYHVFSSADLKDWTDHGMIVSQEKVPWADPGAYSMWAPDCIERNGKYYFYFPTKAKDTVYGKGFSIGVAISDNPGGPFVPQAEPIAGVHGIDPNVYIDADGQAYLYWAEGNIYAAKLKDNMLELASEPKVLGELPAKGLKEGPYLFERKGIYYLTYPHVQNKTERLEYATGDNPMGPFRFGGVIMDESPTGCWTNHQSIISFKGQWYLFYHHNDLSPGFDKNRSVRIDSLSFEPDGSIRKVIPTLRGVGVTRAGERIEIDRYSRISDHGAAIGFLDTMDRFKGWKTIFTVPGAWVKYDHVDLGQGGAGEVIVRASSATGGRVEVRLDGVEGPVVGSVNVPAGADWGLFRAEVKAGAKGVHDLVVRSPAEGHLEVDWVSFGLPDAKVGGADRGEARNPIIYADVPDMSMIRVGDTYYMSSTTMHLSPGLPIMKSKDLVNWEMVGYAYDTLAHMDELDLTNGKSTYGRGSWASSLRYHNGTFYVSTFAQTTGRTYVYSTKDIEKGPWKCNSFKPSYHDHSLFFDDDGRVYLVTGAGKLRLIELNADASGVKPDGLNEVVIENASEPSGNGGLPAEGSQLFKINGKYYLFNITWPKGGMRTVIIHRADKITGPYEGRIGLQDMGVAQGGLIQATDSNWYAYLFRDNGAVGRVPYLVPVKWEDGWPVLGVGGNGGGGVPATGGKVPGTLDLPVSRGLIPGIVQSDEFSRRRRERDLPLVWQWNHNPDNSLWSVRDRKGYLRLRTGRLDTSFVLARNTLTQRTIGPVCSGVTAVDVSGMKDGDLAGLALLQKKYGLVAVRCDSGRRWIVMISAESGKAVDKQSVPLTGRKVFLKAECDFRDKTDLAKFYYSIDGKSWISIGQPLHMAYTIPHFMGYRFGLFNYATRSAGGFADFDFFHITNSITKTE